MTDSALSATLEMKLGQTEAELRKANAEIERLTAKVKLAGAELDRFKHQSGGAYGEHVSHIKNATVAAEEHHTSLTRLGRALNRIGGAGSGEMLQIAHAVSIISGPLALLAGGALIAQKGWEQFTETMKESKEHISGADKAVRSLQEATRTDREEKGSRAIKELKMKEGLITAYGADGVNLADKFSQKKGITYEDSAKSLIALAPLMKLIDEKDKPKQIENLMEAVKLRSMTGVSMQEATGQILKDPVAADFAKRGQSNKAAARLTGITEEQFNQNVSLIAKDSTYYADARINTSKEYTRAEPEDLNAAIDAAGKEQQFLRTPGARKKFEEDLKNQKKITEKKDAAEQDRKDMIAAQNDFVQTANPIDLGRALYNEHAYQGWMGFGGTRHELIKAKEGAEMSAERTNKELTNGMTKEHAEAIISHLSRLADAAEGNRGSKQ